MKVYEASCAARRLLSENPPPQEEELTRTFLRNLSQNHRVQSYRFSQKAEASIGADWLWLICTEKSVSPFLVQAKVLRGRKQEISAAEAKYISNSGAYQVELLLEESRVTGIPALYVLFSNQIRRVPCGSVPMETPEGVFIESAQRIHRRFLGDGRGGLKHMPISCMFGCFARKCNYDSDDEELCKICLQCKICRRKPYYHSVLHEFPCRAPFEGFMRSEMELQTKDMAISDNLLPLLYCRSILTAHPDYLLKSLTAEFSALSSIPQRVIITDYRNRHREDYCKSIMGQDFELDTKTEYTLEELVPTLYGIRKKYPIIKRIGLFGSYAKELAHPLSDIDLALVYTKSRFRQYTALAELGSFIKEVFEAFHKNIDFIDYEAAKQCDDSQEFIDDIQEDLIWI